VVNQKDTFSIEIDMNEYFFWRGFNKISELVHSFGVFLFAGIIIVLFIQIVLRLIGLSGFDAIEVTSYMLIWVNFACIPSVLRRNRHIKVDLLYANLTRKFRYILDIFAGLVGIAVAIIICWQGILLVLEAHHLNEVTMMYSAPISIITIILPVGMIFFAVEYVEKIIEAVLKYRIAKKENILNSK